MNVSYTYLLLNVSLSKIIYCDILFNQPQNSSILEILLLFCDRLKLLVQAKNFKQNGFSEDSWGKFYATLLIMAILVMYFSREGYKIKMFFG